MAARTGCYLCERSYLDPRECRRHFLKKHKAEHKQSPFEYERTRTILPAPSSPSSSSSLPTTPTPAAIRLPIARDLEMEETSGRGHREKIPSAKIKEQVHKSLEKSESSSNRVNVPTYIAPRDPRFEQEQKEIQKIYDHTKVGPNGEKTEWYTLGNHVESKDKRYYIRAKRDPETLYFHTAEAAPFCARLSDENHPQCAIDNLNNVFTKDMRGKSGEYGSFTSRANVFAREGQFFYEAKILSQAPTNLNIPPRVALAAMQNADRTATDRGGVRIGYCRRETFSGEALGSSAYSYAVVLRDGPGAAYGSVRYHSQLFHVKGKDSGDLAPGDVVGLMITLPPLEVHKKVVQGTFNPADYPHLECGPAKPKAKGKAVKKKEKGVGKEKEKEVDPTKSKAKVDDEKNDDRALIRSALNAATGLDIPTDHDIVRDRNPFIHKNGPCYFECPEYTVRPDLDRPTNVTRQKSINPETGKPYDMVTDPHPQHELPHLRTLPGSKIEMWVNGKYHGIVWEHLLAFLPPASHIDSNKSRSSMPSDVDDGLLGYYPALTHYTGGAVECKFDGPWWCGYDDGPERPAARPIGQRYKEQIVEDFCADIVDEVYLERLHRDPDWMKKEVVKAGKFNTRE